MNPESFRNDQNEQNNKNENLLNNISIEVLDRDSLTWDKIGGDLMRIEQSSVGEDGEELDEESIREAVENPDSIIVISRDLETNKIIGFTISEPTKSVYNKDDYPGRVANEDTAYISDTAFEQSYQNKGLVVPMIEELERQMISKGYSFMERDSMDENPDEKGETYADKIRKSYKDRIDKEEVVEDSDYGRQVYFRIKLK